MGALANGWRTHHPRPQQLPDFIAPATPRGNYTISSIKSRPIHRLFISDAL